MPGSRIKGARTASRHAAAWHLLGAASIGLAGLSLLGLRGAAGLSLSPAASFGSGVAALAIATQIWGSRGRDGLQTLGEIALALAIAACAAAAVVAFASGHA